MPDFDIVKKHNPEKTFRVASIIGKFDLQGNHVEERFKGKLDLPALGAWQIGAIVGKSGTGKTTIAKQIFPESYIQGFEYKESSILDDMPENSSVEDITRAFNSVGFSSPPSWLKPYSVLSTGEKMRADLAHCLLKKEELFVFDEFTSVVDRNVAKIGSHAIQKAIRRTQKKFIAISCHFDIVDWLQPDWVFSTDMMTLENQVKKKDQKLNSKSTEQRIKEFGKCFLSITI